MKDRIVFMGTPEFAVAILGELLAEERNVVGVVCQPDKPVGRRQVLTCPPVKELALQHEIPVFQPVRIRSEYEDILALEPDLIVTCAYGQMIPDEVLNYPKKGSINVHASLLPKLRGGAPIQHAIIDGYDRTGITIMKMVRRMDAGDIISQKECLIDPDDTYGTLHDRLIETAVELFRETIDGILAGEYESLPQDEAEVTFGFNITKEEERLDLTRSYDEVYNRIRGLIPVPCSYFMVDGKKVKIWSAERSEDEVPGENGTLIVEKNRFGIAVDGRAIWISELQPEGKKRMPAADFLNGAGRSWKNKVAE